MNLKYVYKHVDPKTGEVVYVGRGRGTRAFLMRNTGGELSPRYGDRSKPHADWLQEQEKRGHTMLEIVKIERRHRRLTTERSRIIETVLIMEHYPRFNRLKGPGSKADPVVMNEIVELYKQIKSHRRVASLLGVSSKTVQRHLQHVKRSQQ